MGKSQIPILLKNLKSLFSNPKSHDPNPNPKSQFFYIYINMNYDLYNIEQN